MNQRTWRVSLLLFGSGTCALIYQVAWLREFRLVFGASTAASAAVLAIFMAGLGVGGILLGQRADRHPSPLSFYGQLEMLIAASAALTPLLIWLSSALYVGLGGSVSLGLIGATILRLILSAIVLSIPTVLMGGTLPAAARSIESDEDLGRRRLAVLYGANTIGAVTGALLSTFILLEVLGTHKTLWAACIINLAIGGLAWKLAQGKTPTRREAHTPKAPASPQPEKAASAAPRPRAQGMPARFILILAGVVGFAFFLMEIVWYRMLAPILGGTTYTFGLILAIALLGIGVGGAIYSMFGRNRVATLSGLATTCALEGLFIAIPFALGDRMAILAALLRNLGSIGFGGNVLGWSLVTTIVVFPVALVAGIQFPMLIALLGRGVRDVGSHIGAAYAWNTGGAIIGSLAGGFGLLPLLGALGTWSAAAILLAAFAVATGLASIRVEKRMLSLLPSAIAIVCCLGFLAFSNGPTGAWRYSSIGAGRAQIGKTRNEIRDWRQSRNRLVKWTAEGVESNICLTNATGLALLNNGKSDGHSLMDAPTVIMLGMTSGLLHPNPQTALVVGLGTGTTAGWLAAIPSIERVDVVELEPAVREVARRCAPVNHDMLNDPKVHLIIGDGREVLLTSSRRYDLIVSQPSNPFRAGVSSLFSKEFYEAVNSRLNDGGIFTQWAQAYEIDLLTMRSVYATLTSVFPNVETWQTMSNDVLLACSRSSITYDVPRLRHRLQAEPFKSAVLNSWRATDLEGVLSRYVGRNSFAVSFGKGKGGIVNTDDLNTLDYSFARTVGREFGWTLNDLKAVARQNRADQPDLTGGPVDWERVEDARICLDAMQMQTPAMTDHLTVEQRHRADAHVAFMNQNFPGIWDAWKQQPEPPRTPTELAVVAYSMADQGMDECRPYIDQLRVTEPIEADVLWAHLMIRKGDFKHATELFVSVFERYRTDPWPWTSIMTIALLDADALATQVDGTAAPLWEALKQPFVVDALNEKRIFNALTVASKVGRDTAIEAMKAYEPNVPWIGQFLARRLELYTIANYPLAAVARKDLAEYLEDEPSQLTELGTTGASATAK